MTYQEEIELVKYKARRQQQFQATYMEIAYQISKLSYCQKRRVGAVIVNNGNIVGFGFNGAVSGMPNICEDDEGADERTKDIHAEINALLKAGVLARGGAMYTTTYPCGNCTAVMAQAGIKEIYYLEDHKVDGRVELYGMFAIKLEL